MSKLGRRIPTDWNHVETYRLRGLAPKPDTVELSLKLPAGYRARYDQGNSEACVGFASSWLSSLNNRRFYDAPWLYGSAQEVDEYADTPPAGGTSVRAGMDVLRTEGHRRVLRGRSRPVDPKEGIAANRWATTVDQVRLALSDAAPVVLGINWYEGFFSPERAHGGWWIGGAMASAWGNVVGGHAICAYAASDRRQAVRLVNSWGSSYPSVWLAYTSLGRLLDEYGEAAVVTDR